MDPTPGTGSDRERATPRDGEPAPARRFGNAPVDAADLSPDRRPGVPAERPPQPWPNAVPEDRIERMRAPPSTPRHGRAGRRMPPVYGTAVPLRGLSGAIRREAYRFPDHVATHWLLLLLGDRVDSWGTRASRLLRIGAPVAVIALLASRAFGVTLRNLSPRRLAGLVR